MLDVDVGGRVPFQAVLDQGHRAARGEAGTDGGEHGLRLLELVVDVHEEDAVDAPGRELGIGLGAQDGDDVGDPLLGGALLQEVDHLGLDVLGVDLAGRPHGLRQPAAEETGAGADLRHGHPLPDLHRLDHHLGFLRLGPPLPLQPVRVLVAHHVRRLALRQGRCGRLTARRQRRAAGEDQEDQRPSPAELGGAGVVGHGVSPARDRVQLFRTTESRGRAIPAPLHVFLWTCCA